MSSLKFNTSDCMLQRNIKFILYHIWKKILRKSLESLKKKLKYMFICVVQLTVKIVPYHTIKNIFLLIEICFGAKDWNNSAKVKTYRLQTSWHLLAPSILPYLLWIFSSSPNYLMHPDWKKYLINVQFPGLGWTESLRDICQQWVKWSC